MVDIPVVVVDSSALTTSESIAGSHPGHAEAVDERATAAIRKLLGPFIVPREGECLDFWNAGRKVDLSCREQESIESRERQGRRRFPSLMLYHRSRNRGRKINLSLYVASCSQSF
jgi:hypothetical protein